MPAREIHASVGQRLLWLKLEHERWSAAYNCPIVCALDGPLDRHRLGEAVNALYVRHDALRTTVVRRHPELRQIVHPATPVLETCHDLSETGESGDRQLSQEIATPIDPTRCASRITVWRLGAERHLLCINLHHLIADTWSCMVLQRELPVLYGQDGGQPVSALPPVAWQFGQFMAHQQREIAGEGFRRHREYWESQLTGARAPKLPLGDAEARRVRPRAMVAGQIDPQTTRAIRALSARHRVTPFTILLSVFKVLLQLLTSQSDLTVATMFANRLRPEVEHTVGFIANLVLLRTQLERVSTFTDVLSRVHSTVTAGIAHQAFPHHLAMRRTPAPRGARLDRVVFQMLGERIDQTCRAADVTFRWLVPEVEGRFDLELAVMPLDDVMGVKLHYAIDGTSAAWASDFLNAYLTLTSAFAGAPDAPLADSTAVAPPVN